MSSTRLLTTRVDVGTKGYVEGRRRFGSVGKAVVDVLTTANRELTAHEIRLNTETLLGGAVSTNSIIYQLRSKSRGRTPAIVQRARRYYRLADSRILIGSYADLRKP